MVVRRGTAARRTAAPQKAATTRKPAPVKRQAAPAKKASPDVTAYADKEPTGYHRAFAKWIVTAVGYEPNSAASKRAAFLAGVSIATAARPAFQQSDFLEEYREKTGEAKRGPKPAARPTPKAGTRKAAPPVDEDEFDDSDDELEDEDEFDGEEEDDETDADEFDDDDEESDDEDDEDEFDDEEEPEPEPAPKRRAPARGVAKTSTPGRSTRGSAASKKAPARRTAKPPADDEELF